MLSRKTQIAIKAESAEGTAESLAASDAVLVYEPLPTFDFGFNPRDPASESLDPLPSVTGKKMMGTTFGMDVRGSGAVGTAPDWDVPLKGAGHGRSVISTIAIGTVANGPVKPGSIVTGGTSAGTGRVVGVVINGDATLLYVALSGALTSGETLTVTGSTATIATSGSPAASKGFEYLPLNGTEISATLGVYRDGIRHLGSGGRAQLAINLGVNSIGRMAFTYRSVYAGTTDLALLSGTTFQTEVPPAVRGVSLYVAGYSPKFTQFSFAGQGVLSDRDDATASSGVRSVAITKRTPKLSIDPEMALVATHDW